MLYQTEAVERMLQWIDTHPAESPMLPAMSREIGYSPCYCSALFHGVVGMPLKTYAAGRRLSLATLEVRDTQERILDIAVKYGFSSQEALTRAFQRAYGCTPAVYRRSPRPVPLPVRQNVLFPEYYEGKGELTMEKSNLREPTVRVEYVPAHKYLGIWEPKADSYFGFWEHHDCDEVCGTVDSLSHVMHPVVVGHTAGWYPAEGGRGYFYGLGVAEDYAGPIPQGFELREVPGSYYLVFSHPPFDFLTECAQVMERVESLAWSFDPGPRGFQWNERACPDYQRHWPETLGYEVLRPVRPLKP